MLMASINTVTGTKAADIKYFAPDKWQNQKIFKKKPQFVSMYPEDHPLIHSFVSWPRFTQVTIEMIHTLYFNETSDNFSASQTQNLAPVSWISGILASSLRTSVTCSHCAAQSAAKWTTVNDEALKIIEFTVANWTTGNLLSLVHPLGVQTSGYVIF